MIKSKDAPKRMSEKHNLTQKLEVSINVLSFSLILQILFVVVYILNYAGIGIPLLRQVVGLFYSLFVPGMLIMLALKIDEDDHLNSLLYCVGLSLSSLMTLGLILNFAGPLVGITHPLSTHPTCISIIAFSATLWIFCLLYRRRNAVVSFRISRELIPWIIVLLFPVLLSVFGAYLVYYEGNNMLLLTLLLIIALMAFSPLSKRTRSLYPLIIFVASLSLIYHIVLSSYSFGGDTHIEYGFSTLALEKGIWDPSMMANSVNALASINILVPVLCQLNAMNVLQVFKIFYPIVLSFVPLGLYSVLSRQIEPDLAFFSVYFYVSVRFFYAWVSEFVKQGFAMFFLMLIILILTSEMKRNVMRELVLILFSFSLIVSHYGVSHLFLIFILIAHTLQLLFFEKRGFDQSFSLYYIPLYMVLTVSWYMYVSSGSAFESIITVGDRIISNIHEFLNPETSDTLALLTKENPFLSKITLKGLYLLTNAFIMLGFSMFIYNKLKGAKDAGWNLNTNYTSFSVPSLGFLAASLLPYVTKHAMDIGRSYCILLLFLAPFCIMGFAGILKSVKKFFRRNVDTVKALAIFFAIFSLFNSGWVTEVAGEKDVGSVAISQARIKSSGTPYEKASLYTAYFAEEDIFSAKWLSEFRTSSLVSSDFYALKVLTSYGMFVGKGIPSGKELLTSNSINELDEGTYVYLRKLNWKDGIMTKFIWEKDWIWNTSDIMPRLYEMNLIYSNGGSVIFIKD